MSWISRIAISTSIVIGISAISLLSATQAAARENFVQDSPYTKLDKLDRFVVDLSRIGRCTFPTYSADGKTIGFVSDLSGTPQIYTVSKPGEWPRQITDLDVPVIGFQWSPNADLIALLAGAGQRQLYVVRPDGTGLKCLAETDREEHFIDGFTPDGKNIKLTINGHDKSDNQSVLVDPTSGKRRLISSSRKDSIIWDIDENSKYALYAEWNTTDDNNLYLIDLDTGEKTLLTAHQGRREYIGGGINRCGPRLSADCKFVYFATNTSKERMGLARIAIKDDLTGGPLEVVAADPKANLCGFVLDKEENKALLVFSETFKHRLSICDLSTGKTAPCAALPGEFTYGLDMSPDGRKVVLQIEGQAQPTDIWELDLDSQLYRQITYSQHPGVDLARLVKPQYVQLKSPTGHKIDGVLFKPADSNRPVPFVLNFRGTRGFNIDAQILAANGIGVFCHNGPGLYGRFGQEFFATWSRSEERQKIIDDIKTSVDYLVKSQNADRDRIGVYGYSFDGYMALVSLTELPDLFNAATIKNAHMNFATEFAGDKKKFWTTICERNNWDTKTAEQIIARLSPINKVSHVKCPTLFLYGELDESPKSEVAHLRANLMSRNIPVEYVELKDEGHSFLSDTGRVKAISSMVNFFRRHL